MAEHQHGTMDISVQEKTFSSFISITTKCCVALAVFAVFLAVFAS